MNDITEPNYAAGLPEVCAHQPDPDGFTVLIERGVAGFTSAVYIVDAEAWNAEQGITEGQRKAMVFGSMFGWHVPGADPARYHDDGQLKT